MVTHVTVRACCFRSVTIFIFTYFDGNSIFLNQLLFDYMATHLNALKQHLSVWSVYVTRSDPLAHGSARDPAGAARSSRENTFGKNVIQ